MVATLSRWRHAECLHSITHAVMGECFGEGHGHAGLILGYSLLSLEELDAAVKILASCW